MSFLKKTANSFLNVISFIKNHDSMDSIDIENLEEKLLLCDVGFEITNKIIESISKNYSKNLNLNDHIKQTLKDMLDFSMNKETLKSKVLLISGVNGTGKTTFCAKLSNYMKLHNKNICLIAADTFRAAAVEQLKYWSTKNDIPCISNSNSNDPSSVIFDGLKSELSQNADLTIIDTAGRINTNTNLMNELSKIEKIIKRFTNSFDSWLSIDANLGQNSLSQIETFKKNININGVVINKMDGSSKGGIAFPIIYKYKIPITFIGIGEKNTDILPFDLNDYLDKLLYEEN